MVLDERLEYAKRIISNYLYKVKDFEKIYPFTTENLNGYMSMYDFKDKDVLTVGSSCDQIFNSYLMGAKRIVCFDINPLCEDYFNLKKAAFLSLSYEEFVKFFCYHTKNNFMFNMASFNNDTFYDILPNISDDGYYFWMRLFNLFSGSKIRYKLFSKDEEEFKVLSKANSFMSKDRYYELKDKVSLLHPTFVNCDLRNVTESINETFDYIMLSNIACFIQRMYNNPLEDFRIDVLKIMNLLNDNGVLFLAYLYDMTENTIIKPHWDLIYQLDKVFDVFKREKLSYNSFIGIQGLIHDDIKQKDMVLTLRK